MRLCLSESTIKKRIVKSAVLIKPIFFTPRLIFNIFKIINSNPRMTGIPRIDNNIIFTQLLRLYLLNYQDTNQKSIR